ncbi:MAG: cupin domain-containing protein [Intrasporangium sp.]|uniref:cupin domain-containing protein n=1 Tax=Intrasporangium sp. TaxID=1925024 RepID=UPI003F7DB88B
MSTSTTSRVSAAHGGHPAFAELVSVPLDEFAQRYWSRQPLVSRAEELAGDPAGLLDAAAVDELVSSRALRVPFVRVAKEGRTLGDAEFTQGGGVGAEIADQVSDDKLLRLFRDGATIVLQGLHRSWQPVLTFSQALSEQLRHPVQVNAYVTPSQNRGFNDHYDVHDVFVLQTCGEKRWRLHPPVHEAPLRDEPWTEYRSGVEVAAQQESSHEFTLRPGDCLYLPRGWLHSATALGGVSIHLTIGVHVWTRRHLADELMRLALGSASKDAALRASLPVGVDVGSAQDIGDDVDQARAALIAALQAATPDQVAAALECRWRGAVRAAPIGPLAQLEAAERLRPETGLRLREHLVARLDPQLDGTVRLVSRAAALTLTAAEGDALTALLDGETLPADLIGMELASRLLRAGLAVPDR